MTEAGEESGIVWADGILCDWLLAIFVMARELLFQIAVFYMGPIRNGVATCEARNEARRPARRTLPGNRVMA